MNLRRKPSAPGPARSYPHLVGTGPASAGARGGPERLYAGQRASQAVIWEGTIYLSGQTGEPGLPLKAQAQGALERVETLLDEAGSDKSKILMATIRLADMGDCAAFSEVWDAWIGGRDAPARSISEARLAAPGSKVEIVVVAARPRPSDLSSPCPTCDR
ncbi:RidA family protein [Phenylobacterium sp.]|uniref:RidA family protein n=1 Tax=Phenylobacterium sp. TaxID=1871053 RepID=UPI0035B2BAC4